MEGGAVPSFLLLVFIYSLRHDCLRIVEVLIPICSSAPMHGQRTVGTDSLDMPAGWTVLTQHRKILLPPETRFREHVTHIWPLVEVLQFYSWACPGLLWSPGFPNHNPVYLPSSLVLQDLGWMSSGSDTYLNQGIIAHHFSVRATVELACYLTALSCFEVFLVWCRFLCKKWDPQSWPGVHVPEYSLFTGPEICSV